MIRAFVPIANELSETGYSAKDVEKISAEVEHAANVRDVILIASENCIDLKACKPAMRHLMDTYLRAEASEKISSFDDMSPIQLIVELGPDAG